MDRANEPTPTSAGTTPALKEVVFSLIKKLEKGITDGRQQLWAWFSDAPHVLLKRNGDGYVVLLWRDGVYIEVTLDERFEITGFDVEVRP